MCLSLPAVGPRAELLPSPRALPVTAWPGTLTPARNTIAVTRGLSPNRWAETLMPPSPPLPVTLRTDHRPRIPRAC